MSNQEIYNSRIDFYKEQLELHNSRLQYLEKRSITLSLLRLFIFVALISSTIYTLSNWSLAALAISVFGISTFIYVIKIHLKTTSRITYFENKRRIVQNEISAVTTLQNENYNGEKFVDEKHSYSWDLDVFGKFSLFALINRCRSFKGIEQLSNILSNLPDYKRLFERNRAIRELEEDPDWRIDFFTTLYPIENGHTIDVDAEIKMALDLDLNFADSSILPYYSNVLFVFWPFAIAVYFLNSSLAVILILLVSLINFRLLSKNARDVTELQNRLSLVSRDLMIYDKCMSVILLKNWNSQLITELITPFSNGKELACFRQLKRISDYLDYRLNAIVSFVINLGFLWDLRVVNMFLKWRAKHSKDITQILSVIGSLEAISTLANWSFNHPEYVYPVYSEDYFELSAREIRHPLIARNNAVANDFVINKGEFISLITGSNMSGKSTFLRTIGLNIILGNAGARVAADYLSYGLTHLITYMRIKDSLVEDESTFKAELTRVDLILRELERNRPVFILADEMLRGTNSEDKMRGSKAIINRIIDCQSYAMIATHDLSLTQSNSDSLVNYYFDIDYRDDQLLFDYKIKEGVCTSFNASILLEKLGLDITED